VTHEAAGVILFKHIFRIAPQALPLFSFGRVEGAEVNDALFEDEALKAHATKVVATVATCARIKISGAHAGTQVATAVGMLTKLDELVPILTSLGTKHVGYGVVPEHYAVVGEALIATLSDALGDAFDAETKEAWIAVYGIVQKTMIGDNYDN
jgi:ABC-type glucose/galactose transport system permease subunit